MSLESVLVARLEATAGLIALIGSPPNARIYALTLPQSGNVYPAISYQRISSVRTSNMGVDAGLVDARFEFDVWGKDERSVRDVTEQLRLALQRFRSAGPPVIQDIFMLNQVEFFEDSTRTYRIAVDFRVHYQE